MKANNPVKAIIFLGLFTLLTFSLTGCGGGGGSSSDSDGGCQVGGTCGSSSGTGTGTGTGTGGGGTGGGGGGSSSSGVPAQIGFFDNAGNFQAGVIGTSNFSGSLSAGGTVGLQVTIVDSDGAPVTDPFDVTFSSTCVTRGASMVDSPVTSVNGTVNSDYTAQGCTGNDTITARIITTNGTFTATVTINVLADVLGSIQFVSADPETIRIQGTGSPDSSLVTFRVTNQSGGDVIGKTVFFTLDNTTGNVRLSNSSSETATGGQATTRLLSGTVQTVVRITAWTCDDTTSGCPVGAAGRIATQSDRIVISTGVFDQNSFSLSQNKTNIDARNRDGEEVEFTILGGDRFNNPVPDGTVIAFRAEAGLIQSQCQTTDGACTVTWRSQTSNSVPRITVLAFSVGEESFVDSNGDGRYQSTDTLEADLAEAFVDANENGTFESPPDTFIDFNNNGAFDATPDGGFTGLLCDSGCSTTGASALNVRDSGIIVISGPEPVFDQASDTRTTKGPITTNCGPNFVSCSIDFTGPNDTVVLTLVVRDSNDQPMAEDTTITVATDLGAVVGMDSQTVPFTSDDSAAANTYSFTFNGPDGATADTGTVTVTITTPRARITEFRVPATYTP